MSLGSSGLLWQFLRRIPCYWHPLVRDLVECPSARMCLWLWVCKRKATEVKHQCHHTWRAHGLYHGWCWTWSPGWQWYLPGFSIVKLFFFPLSIQLLSGRNSTMLSQHLRNGELCSTSLRSEGIHNLFGFLLHSRCLFSPSPFLSLFIQSLICLSMDSDFILWLIA